MIHNMEFFEQIEAYCLNELSEELKKQFEAELHKNPKLRKEVELRMEVQNAIMENDVLTLRDKLGKVTHQGKTANAKVDAFELLDEFSDFQEINEVLTSEELINFYESLPKVHAYHHEATSNETIHPFYKEQQDNAEVDDVEEEFDDFDMEFEGLEEAILEKDILNLRQTLKHVAKSVEPQFTVEEIDDYLSGELVGDELIEFENDLIQNRSLKEEVQLHKELDAAINEYDVMELRDQISNIVQAETSWNVDERSIEDFIDGILEGKELEEFMAEYQDNTDLKAEVRLRKQVNELLGETDIAALRKELITAKEKAEVKKVKMFVPETKVGNVSFWRSSVAVIILLLGITGILSNGLMSTDKLYTKYFETPVWSPERSVTEQVGFLQEANMYYIEGDWAKSLEILTNTPAEHSNNAVFDYYKAVNLQNLGRYNEAITKYTRVIENGDNLYIQEAEWYRSLCYLEFDKKAAKQHLIAIVERKGDYEHNARAILRRLKYSFK